MNTYEWQEVEVNPTEDTMLIVHMDVPEDDDSIYPIAVAYYNDGQWLYEDSGNILPYEVTHYIPSLARPNTTITAESILKNPHRVLTHRFLALPFRKQIDIVKLLHPATLEESHLTDEVIFRKFFKWAADNQSLARLWEETEKRHTDPAPTNPFDYEADAELAAFTEWTRKTQPLLTELIKIQSDYNERLLQWVSKLNKQVAPSWARWVAVDGCGIPTGCWFDKPPIKNVSQSAWDRVDIWDYCADTGVNLRDVWSVALAFRKDEDSLWELADVASIQRSIEYEQQQAK